MTHGINRVAAAGWVAAGVALLAAGSVQAQTAGSIVGRLGATQIRPDVDSGDLSAPSFAGTKADIKPASAITGGITYMLTDNIAVDLPLAAGFKHDIVGAGAIAGVGKIGDVKALPITLLGQYRFMGANDNFRPYLGAGVTYAKFYKARSTAALTALTGGTPSNPTTLEVQSKWAATVQLGGNFTLAQGWSLDATVLKTFLTTRTRLSTGQTLDAKLDPLSISFGIARKF